MRWIPNLIFPCIYNIPYCSTMPPESSPDFLSCPLLPQHHSMLQFQSFLPCLTATRIASVVPVSIYIPVLINFLELILCSPAMLISLMLL